MHRGLIVLLLAWGSASVLGEIPSPPSISVPPRRDTPIVFQGSGVQESPPTFRVDYLSCRVQCTCSATSDPNLPAFKAAVPEFKWARFTFNPNPDAFIAAESDFSVRMLLSAVLQGRALYPSAQAVGDAYCTEACQMHADRAFSTSEVRGIAKEFSVDSACGRTAVSEGTVNLPSEDHLTELRSPEEGGRAPERSPERNRIELNTRTPAELTDAAPKYRRSEKLQKPSKEKPWPLYQK